MTTSTGGAGARCPAWAKLLLIVSLALNAAVIGLYIAQPMKGKRSASGSRQIEWILELVPDDRRDFTKAHFADIRDELRALREQRSDYLDQIVGIVGKEPFVAEDLDLVLEERRDATVMRRKLVHDRLVSLLSEFSAEERAIFAERLAERIKEWRERRGKG